MASRRHDLRRKAPILVGAAFLLLFTAGVVYMVTSFLAAAGKPEAPRVQKISLVRPPPPKPPEEKPPEPEKVEPVKEEVPMEPPPDAPAAAEAAPPGPDLAVEGEGGAGGDGFGLVGKKKVVELGGRGGDREAWYGQMIARHFEDGLRRSKRLRGNDYRVTLAVWFDGVGSVRRVQIEHGSGNPETDAAIRAELLDLQPLREALPDDLAQPVRVRLSSRA